MAYFAKHGRCVMCNKYLQCLHRSYKYTCSAECQRLLVNGQVKGALLNERCAVCDRYFIPKKEGAIYCSEKCRYVKEPNYKSSFSIFKRDGFKCIYCGKSSIEDGAKLAVDHIKAIGIGGLSEINNLITACSKCNSGKNISQLSIDVQQRILTVLVESNKNLSVDEFELVSAEVSRYKENDHQRIMRLSFTKIKAFNDAKKSA